MPQTHWSKLASIFVALMLAFAATAQEAAPKKGEKQPEVAAAKGDEGAYIRIEDSEDGNKATLQIAIKTFEKPGDGRKVHLVGVAHIGDKAYYENLQKFLDAQDLVLFEGVKPGAAASDLENASDAAKVKITKARQRMLAMVVAKYRTQHKKLPETLAEAMAGLNGTAARVTKGALLDAWGHEQTYVLTKADEATGTKAKFDIVSLGSDKAEGGEGAAADLKFSQQKPLTKEEKSGGAGIQTKLAEALGLEFQLAAIDYNREKWRNSDMTVDELEEKLTEAGLSGSALFSMLDGSSMMSKLVSGLLGFVGESPELSFYMKAMMVETLVHADDMLEAQASLGKGMGEFMRVLIMDRNKVVFDDLNKALEKEPQIKTIALFYGAGHLPDMESRLIAMGFQHTDTIWKDAIVVDATKVPGGKSVIKSVRQQVKGMMAQAKKGAGTTKDEAKPEPDAEKVDK